MKLFRDVLLVAGLDDGPVPRHVFDRALRLAQRDRAKLTLIDVCPDHDLASEFLPPELFEFELRKRRRALDRMAQAAQKEGVEVDTQVVTGTAFLEVTRRVQRFKHDLVMTSGGRAEEVGWELDRTTMHLMRKCPCAIWVARPSSGDDYARILAAVDPEATDAESGSLNRKIMELAISMAKLEGSELHVVHVQDLFGWSMSETTDLWKQWEMLARREIERRLHEFLSDYDLDPSPRVHLLAGKPEVGISSLASEKQMDLLVMGTLCRTGIRGFLIGNTAEGVLRRVDCSLLTVKPDGFISPVQPS